MQVNNSVHLDHLVFFSEPFGYRTNELQPQSLLLFASLVSLALFLVFLLSLAMSTDRVVVSGHVEMDIINTNVRSAVRLAHVRADNLSESTAAMMRADWT